MPTAESPKLFAERYLPVRRLGKGGMGLVALAQDTLKGNMLVALKFVCEELGDDTRAIADLTREVINSQRLSHPNILRVYELMKYKDTYFITMEYVEGEDLNKRLGRYQQVGHNFSLEEVLECARQICPALDFAHSQKVLHLDIKPSNIICDERGIYKLMDFGIARSAHESLTRVTKALGYTGGYASPEQVTGKTLGKRTDVYCLTATFYDLLAGKVPCPTDYAAVNVMPVPIAGVPQDINDALLAGLSKDPLERPKTAGDLLNLLLGKDEVIHIPEPPVIPTQIYDTTPQDRSEQVAKQDSIAAPTISDREMVSQLEERIKSEQKLRPLAVTSFVMGLCSLFFAFIPFISIIALGLGITGLVLSIKAGRRAFKLGLSAWKGKGLKTAGLILSIIGIFLCVVYIFVYIFNFLIIANVHDTGWSHSEMRETQVEQAIEPPKPETAPAVPTPVGQPEPPWNSNGRLKVLATSGLNVRRDPNLTSEAVDYLFYDDYYNYDKKARDSEMILWYRVSGAKYGKTGWVRASLEGKDLVREVPIPAPAAPAPPVPGGK